MSLAIVLIVFLPLAAAAVAGLFGRILGDRASQFVTCAALLAAAALSIWVFTQVGFNGASGTVQIAQWISSGKFEVNWALRYDTMTAVMLIVVTGVSSMVHVYSVGYMSHDHSIPRFMAYLSLFTFFMLMLVTADNFVQLFFGWEGVGLASYLLIGFWYDRPSANAAAIKAFVVNRVGDFGFALGIFAIFVIFGTVGFDEVFKAAPDKAALGFEFLGMHVNALTCACLLLFVGAMGKSAQLGLHTWLPDAMEGPTPVSALIHAATMVTAGVFMVCRLSPIFEYAPIALDVVTIVGGLTAFFAATVGLTQFDIKRVIAYSTCSQLGYMFFAAGVSAYPASMFHLTTHAFFKALLFLGAGSVIHALSGEQDMRKMGGVWRKIPYTYTLMWVGSLALGGIGIPGVFGFAGFYSKDVILEAAYGAHSGVGMFAFWLGIAAAFMTAFYSWRLLFLTFHGQYRGDHHVLDHAHESPPSMMIPLIVLGIGATFSGIVAFNWFVGEGMESFWRESIKILPAHEALHHAHESPAWVGLLPLIVGLAGIALAYLFYIARPDLPAKFIRQVRPIYLFFYNKWYFDELYDAIFVRPAFALARGFWKKGDVGIIDGLGPDGLAEVSRGVARGASRLQSGYIYHYAFVMLIGVVALVSLYLLSTGK